MKDILRQEEALALVSPDYIVDEHSKIKGLKVTFDDLHWSWRNRSW
jgi:hypothetical protein